MLGKRKAKIAENKFLDKEKLERIKLADFVNLFIETHSKVNKTSWKDDSERLDKFVTFIRASKFMDEITPYDIELFKKHKLEEGNKPSTVNRYLTIIETMFNKARQWGNVKENPLHNVKHFKEDNCRIRYLEKEGLVRLLDVCSPCLRQAVLFALNTGARHSEQFNLQWSSVDFKSNLIYFNKTKNKKRKIIPINNLLRKILLNLKEQSSSEFVFPVYGIRNSFEKAVDNAKIENLHWHDLRHTYASYLVMNGVDLVTVKELMGHKRIEMTLRYAHLSQDHKVRAVEVLGSQIDTIWTPKGTTKTVENLVAV